MSTSNNRPSSNNRPLATREWIDEDNELADTTEATIYATDTRVIKCFHSHVPTYDIEHEYQIMKYLNHNPHTINVYGNFTLTKGKKRYRVIEMERGWVNAFDFFNELREDETPLTPRQELTFAFTVIYALLKMWEMGIVHNDLHLENIFIMQQKTSESKYEVDGVQFDASDFEYGIKIADFGLSVKWSEPQSLIKFDEYNMVLPSEPIELYDVIKFCRCLYEFNLDTDVATKILKQYNFNIKRDFGKELQPKVKAFRKKKGGLKDILLSDVFNELRMN